LPIISVVAEYELMKYSRTEYFAEEIGVRNERPWIHLAGIWNSWSI
jgi:hypothetical protein